MFPVGWRKGRAITLPETSDDESTAFKIMVFVEYKSAMKADFSDVVFVDSVSDPITQLNQRLYLYIESSVSIWIVEVPSKPSAETPIYYVYGNASATLKTDEVADHYWRGTDEKNFEVDLSGGSSDENGAALTSVSASIQSADAISTWHSMVLFRIYIDDNYPFIRTLGMGIYYEAVGYGPFALGRTIGPDKTKSIASSGTEYGTEEFDSTLAVDTLMDLLLKRITLNDCRTYQTIVNLNGYSQKTQHNGAECNNNSTAKIFVNQSSGVPGTLHVYSMEVFNLPQYVIQGTESVWENLPSGDEFDLTADVDFEADETEPFTGQKVTFTDLSDGYPTEWLWEFGDGYTSTDQNPKHRYGYAGTYTVKLTVQNAFGEAEETKEDYITVTDQEDTVVGLMIDDIAFRIQDPRLEGVLNKG